jgi:hypothetical protein
MTDSRPVQLRLILPSVTRLALTEDERDELLRAPRGVVYADRLQLSPRIKRLKAIIDKLDPPAAPVEPFPAPKPPGEQSHAPKRGRR